MTFAILFVSIVILACLVGNRISNRIGVPMLLIFIVLGMFSARMVSFGFRLKTLNWQNKSAPLP